MINKSPYYKYTFYSPSRHIKNVGGRRGHNRTLVTLTSTYAINTYHHLSREFDPHRWSGVLDTPICD